MTNVLLLAFMQGCGARDGLREARDAALDGATAEVEICDGLDNDRDQQVDEIFRNDGGLYLDDQHCGACGKPCPASLPSAAGVACRLGPSGPRCEALACQADFALTREGQCAAVGEHLCLECVDDSGCGPLPSARCATVAGLRRCVVDCDAACPADFVCGLDDDDVPTCLPPTGSCVCTEEAGDFSFACATELGGTCPGRRSCTNGVLSECEGPAERCDSEDNDCDGLFDEDFVDTRGVYSVYVQHCGRCGRDCTVDSGSLLLTCGGDPLSPTCVLDCPDLHDGKQPGDTMDADGLFDNGCECTVIALDDPISEVAGPAIDENCDGADGEVLRTLYVATDGDDSHIGSPTEPLRTVTEALRRAKEPLDAPRDTILVAAGTYAEAIELREGVRLFGGYRRDFLERDTTLHQVRLVAPPSSVRPYGAAATGVGLGTAEATRVSGLWLQGRDGTEPGAPAVAVLLDGPGTKLVLDDLTLVSGRPAQGQAGAPGASGSAPTQAASQGAAPRGAVEDDNHLCIADASNLVAGGGGGQNLCSGEDVSGGGGGSGDCPVFYERAASGTSGRGAGSATGGLGGYDVAGPISNGAGCSTTVCCGLADFTVPPGYEQAHPGSSGRDGASGASGLGCSDPYGWFIGGVYMAGQATAGSVGQAGGGGGGGGAGGGAEITFVDGDCPYADGLGGGGGGGGAGGCGGNGGAAGQSAGPAVALFLANASSGLPQLSRLALMPSDGQKGGDGGDGGDGGKGGQGAAGGAQTLESRSTPTLAGPSPGERGGNGGNGGPGGGGGGGCGGASVGLWLSGMAEDAALRAQLMMDHNFVLGVGGAGGLGGGGAVTGSAGQSGISEAVVFR